MNFADTTIQGTPVVIDRSGLNTVLSSLIYDKLFGTPFTSEFLASNGIVSRKDRKPLAQNEFRHTLYLLTAGEVFKFIQAGEDATEEFLESNYKRKLVFTQNDLTGSGMCVFFMYVKANPTDVKSWMMPGFLEEMTPISSSFMSKFLVNGVVPPPAVPSIEKPYSAVSGNGTFH